MPSTSELQSSAHDMIVSWNGGSVSNGKLARGAAQRNCTCAIMDYTPTEHNSIQVDGLTKIRISKIGLAVDVDPKLDVLTAFGKTYKINAPPRGPKPAGTFVYIDCDCLEIAP